MNLIDRQPQIALTLDVEDWFEANYAGLNRGRTKSEAAAVMYSIEASVDRWISICDEYSARSTCFVLGDFARAFPAAVERLAQAGHEIGCHGDTHDLLFELKEDNWGGMLDRAVAAIQNACGVTPKGFRAPSWSVNHQMYDRWMKFLADRGFDYDASVLVSTLPIGGDPRLGSDVPCERHEIWSIPVPLTFKKWGGVPYSSGTFFRLFPESWILRSLGSTPYPMVVLHPRELDPGHPRLPLRFPYSITHYGGLKGVESKLRKILSRYQGVSLSQQLDEIK